MIINEEKKPTLGDILNGGSSEFCNNQDDLSGKININNAKFKKLGKKLQNDLINLAETNKTIGKKQMGKDGIKKHNTNGHLIYIFKLLGHQKRVAFVWRNRMLEMISEEDGGGSNTTDFLLNKALQFLAPEKPNKQEIQPTQVYYQAAKDYTLTNKINNIRDTIARLITEAETKEREIIIELAKNEGRQEILNELNKLNLFNTI